MATSDRAFCEYISQKPQPSPQTNPADMTHQLLDRLLEHHHVPIGPVCDDPLSLKQLQLDLGWKASDVQRTMTSIFQRRPFTAYKKRCSDGTIGTFLEGCDGQRADRTNAQQHVVDPCTPQTV